jgi:hypothetical protein
MTAVDRSRSGAPLIVKRGIEVGHIFKLGTKYSEAMKCEVADPQQKMIPLTMGCYGLGIGRTVAAGVFGVEDLGSHRDDRSAAPAVNAVGECQSVEKGRGFVVDAVFVEVGAARARQHLAHRQRGAAGRVDLVLVVGFHDLDVVAVAPAANFSLKKWRMAECGSEMAPCTGDIIPMAPFQQLCAGIQKGPSHTCDWFRLPLDGHLTCHAHHAFECRMWFEGSMKS